MDPPLGPMDREYHGQRSLVGYRHGVTRVRHDLATKPPPSRNKSNQQRQTQIPPDVGSIKEDA